MSQETYPAELQAMIDRAGTLTDEETDVLGTLWEAEEDLALPKPSIGQEMFGELDYPIVTNEALLAAWQRALDAAGNANPVRLDAIEAARAAGRAAKRGERHVKASASSKNGAEEAVRSAVLAVGVRDLISDADYKVLVAPWQQALKTI